MRFIFSVMLFLRDHGKVQFLSAASPVAGSSVMEQDVNGLMTSNESVDHNPLEKSIYALLEQAAERSENR